MDNLFLDTMFFFVPNRLVFDHWPNLNGEQRNPSDTTDYLVPTINSGSGFEVGSLADYFGIPTGVPNLEVNALPFRAYNLIYNEWFKSEDLQDSVPDNHDDGPDNKSDYNLLRRCKRLDYFTSCLPWPQKGPGVSLSLATQAPVVGFTDVGSALDVPSYHMPSISHAYGTIVGNSDNKYDVYSSASVSTTSQRKAKDVPINAIMSSDTSGVYADLTSATSITILSLYQAFHLQELYQRDAVGGTRYTEVLRAHFGVTSPDARLQRPEYLGGSSSLVNINPVQQTSSSDSTTPQGNLAAYGVCGDTIHGFTKSFTEHGYIIGLVNVRADLTYQQGLNRMWSRRTRFDFYWPSLAHLGEQAVLNKEIYAQGNADDDKVFGYQERYSCYRYFPSLITGKLRSTDSQSLDCWHLSQKFDSLPVLNSEFIVDNPPLDRVLAVTDEPQFIMDVYFKMSCVRPMPVYSVPSICGHL